MLLPFALLLFAVSVQAKNKTELEYYRKDLMKHLLRNIPFNMAPFKLQNAAAPPTEEKVVKFFLYTRKAPRRSILINEDASLVDPDLPVKLLVHGWTEHYYVVWCKNLTRAYLQKGKYNVIVLDWSKRGDADYVSASMACKEVGDIIGDFLVEKLHKERKIQWKNIHLVSHSLGCHVAGMIGQRVFQLTKKKVARITALDPAAPIFDLFTVGTNDRLSPDDADFVDIIHTDGGMLGFKNSIGSADFYPNGGKAIQPGCSLLKNNVQYEDCSHARSHKYFLNSVLTKKMYAIPCDSWERFNQGACTNTSAVRFGDDAPNNISGNYFFQTPEILYAVDGFHN